MNRLELADRPALNLDGLEQRIDAICALVDRLRGEKAELLAVIKAQRCSYCGYSFGVPRSEPGRTCPTCSPMIAAIARAEGRAS